MASKMELFYSTIQIVFGILFPIICVIVLIMVVIIGRSLPHILELKVEEIKKQPPFDEVEVNVNPATNVMTARFLKKDVIIWQGSSSRHEMEENNTLVFKTEESNG